MSLDVEISEIMRRGRKAADLRLGDSRPMVPEDLALLDSRESIEAEPIKRITSRHHMVARLLAGGMPPGEVALATNYSASRISILQQSPAMKELIALYSEEVEAEFAPILESLVSLGKDAISLLQERLEEDPESLSVSDLLKIKEASLDRVGHPRAKEVNTNVTFDLGSRLDAARRRAKEARLQSIPDAEILPSEDSE